MCLVQQLARRIMQARSFEMHHRESQVSSHTRFCLDTALSFSPQNRTHTYLDFVVEKLECKKKKVKEKGNEVVH